MVRPHAPAEPAHTRGNLALLAERADLTRPVSLAREHLLPVHDALSPLLPEGGLRRGSVLQVAPGPASVSIALALAAEASRTGSWVMVIGNPSRSLCGVLAAGELGIGLERLVMVDPGDQPWATVVAAGIDAVDVVLTWPPSRVSGADGRRLVSRVRERKAVLLAVGPPAEGLDSELRFEAGAVRWSGLGEGHGHLAERRVEIVAAGRRAASRPRRVEVLLPARSGGIEPAPAAGPDGVAAVLSMAGRERRHPEPAVR